jgi:vitamin B12 transporter
MFLVSRRLCAFAAAFAYFSSVHAQTYNDAVIVTATRTSQTIDDTLAPVTVITREDIVRLQAQSVEDVLRGTAGVSIGNSGGAGKLTSLFLRGMNSGHVLVLVDGIKVGSATAGTTPFEHVPLELVERIEVVRGPRSSLYGSEAIGGVVQIFTRREKKGINPSFSVSAGSDNTSKASTGLAVGGESGWLNANVSYAYTNGFNACSGKAPTPPFFLDGAGCFANEPDKDAYRNHAGSLSGGWRFANGAEISANYLRSEGTVEYDGSLQNESDVAQEVLGTRLRFEANRHWTLSLSAGRSKDESDNYMDGFFVSDFDTTRDSLSWQNDFSLTAGQMLSLGVDWIEDSVDSTVPYDVDSRDNTGVFAQYQAAFGQHDLQLAARYDDNEQFGGHDTGSAAWGYALSDTLRAYISYGTAFKAPTFNDLYFPGFSNPDLDPERSRSVELGLTGKYDQGSWSLNAFETRITDLIGFDTVFNIVNIDEARIRGLEVTWDGRLQQWLFSLNLTLLDPENRSNGSNRGNGLPRRAEESLRLDVDREFGAFRAGATVQAAGRRFDDAANTARLGGYGVVDLRAEYRLSKGWLAQARVANLFDNEYETVDYFNQPGRTVLFTLRFEP